MNKLIPVVSGLVFAVAVGTTCAMAQCTNQWVPFGAPNGVGGPTECSLAWDPDGAGPLPDRLVVGGHFTTAGNVFASNIAVWDPATGAWSALGSGCNSNVLALAALPNGDLVAAGQFTQAGGVPVNYIAKWNGVAWSPLGAGIGVYPSALAVLANGDLVVGGSFSHAGGGAVDRVARWDGSSWSALGGGLPNTIVRALASMPNGDIVAGGTASSGAPAQLARWDGVAWSPLGSGLSGAGASVLALAALPNGDLVVGGYFSGAGGFAANNIARWNGTAWSLLGSGTSAATFSGGVRTLLALPSGDVIAGGGLTLSGSAPMPGVARWNGSTWAPLGSGMRGAKHLWPSGLANATPDVRTLATLGNGALIVGGSFSVAGASAAQHVARWHGTQWSALSSGPGLEAVTDIVTLPSGDLLAVGGFAAAGPLVTNAVARWNGLNWSSLGNAGTNEGGVVQAATRLPNGDLVVGGAFQSIGGVPATNVARWNGTQWSAMGALPGYAVYDLIVSPNGTLYAGGSFYPASAAGVFVWNGSAWNAVVGVSGDVYVLAVLPDGRLVAGGFCSPAYVSVWDGVTWAPLGSGLQDIVKSFAIMPNGDLVAATGYGGLTGPGFRWNGATWSMIAGLGSFDAFAALPNGDLLAARGPGVVRWNGSVWSVLGSDFFGRVTTMTSSPSGDVWIGGTFAAVDGSPSSGIARLTTTCPATAQTQGMGCAGHTVTSSLPWTGGSWRADASGLPNAALVFVVNGFAPTSLPLSSVFATALPGCTLHVQPDHVELALANAGSVSTQLSLPNTQVLAGAVFHHQMVPLALDATLAVTATNALVLTVGSF